MAGRNEPLDHGQEESASASGGLDSDLINNVRLCSIPG